MAMQSVSWQSNKSMTMHIQRLNKAINSYRTSNPLLFDNRHQSPNYNPNPNPPSYHNNKPHKGIHKKAYLLNPQENHPKNYSIG